MPTTGVNGIALAAVAGGGLFLYSAISNKSTLKVLHSTLTGNAPSTVAPNPSVVDSGNSANGGTNTSTPQTPVSASSGGNVGMAKMYAAQRGWTGPEWDALQNLWNKESGFNNTADTRKTGAGGDNASSSVFAYGIAQARPATKYPLAGQPPDLGGKADPATQIQWGLDYIASTYGTPSAAWAHETANNWY